eukprot:scaffold189862_cov34-Tisochrysis_lutea.AAC.1
MRRHSGLLTSPRKGGDPRWQSVEAQRSAVCPRTRWEQQGDRHDRDDVLGSLRLELRRANRHEAQVSDE